MNTQSNTLSKQLIIDGYLHIPSNLYIKNTEDIQSVKKIQESYFRLIADDNGGQRFRAYKKFYLENNLSLLDSSEQEYVQSKEFNYALGGLLRKFNPIEQEICKMSFLSHLIKIDTEITLNTGLITFDGSVNIGVHQIRYEPSGNNPSYSAPPWLHKDEEEVVFIHLLNSSANLIGGDSVIAVDEKKFERVIRLNHPLDTLCVTKKHYHAVTPLGICSGEFGYRDVMLVTFKSSQTNE